MRIFRASRVPNCERCPAPRPTEPIVWVRRALFLLALPVSLLWAVYLSEFGPDWVNAPFKRRRNWHLLAYLLPGALTVAAAALLPRPRGWTCPSCGHRNGPTRPSA